MRSSQFRRRIARIANGLLSGSSEFSTCLSHQRGHSTVASRCAPGLSASSFAVMAAKNSQSWLASRQPNVWFNAVR
jgi:hypothetical protein